MRDQCQTFEVIDASGAGAGIQGREQAAAARAAAIEAGVLTEPTSPLVK
jgi:hypothetical protein